MRVDSRLGGHIVMGHVDGIGRIARHRQVRAIRIRFEIEMPGELSRYIVKKGLGRHRWNKLDSQRAT